MGRKEPNREQAEKTRQSRWGFRGMTVRDWLPIVGALLIPVVIAAGTWGITWQQAKIEDRRAQAERELAEQRAQDEALQAYFDQMSSLLLEKDLRNSEEGDEVRTLAKARTVTILRRLDSSRNSDVLQFLREARLVPTNSYDFQEHIITLNASNLSHADLAGVNLDSFDLQGTDLSGADLTDAYLAWSFLRNARLKGANMQGADLHGDTDLSQADLRDADLSGAILRGATLTNADLTAVPVNIDPCASLWA